MGTEPWRRPPREGKPHVLRWGGMWICYDEQHYIGSSLGPLVAYGNYLFYKSLPARGHD